MNTPLQPGRSRPGVFFHRFGTAVAEWWGEKPLLQLAGILLLLALFGAGGHNAAEAMGQYGLTPGYGFLTRPASFEIGESLISYTSRDSYARALLVGLLNTVKVSLIGCFLAGTLGLVLGIARLSGNPLLSRLVQAYVELVRNTPLLLQLFFWSAIVQALPSPRAALEPIPGVFLTNRGVLIPAITASLTLEIPELRGFNFRGGWVISPEFATLLIGLTVNFAASISEIVRSGIQSVPRGQWEAARALGLGSGGILRLVILPQALRVMVPLLTSAFLSLTKSSSLAVAIGFPDVTSVLATSANQTGQALEVIGLLIAVYLSLSLAVSAMLNAYNRRFQRWDRR